MNARSVVDQLSPSELKSLVQRGIIRVTMTNEKLPMCIEDTPEFILFKKLKGKEIGVAEAARKYNIPLGTMARWKTKGFIKIIGHEGSQKILLDEQYVAYCSYVYHLSPGQGRWAFNKNCTPRTQGTNLRNNI